MGPICNLNSNRIKQGAVRDHILSWIKNAKPGGRELRWRGGGGWQPQEAGSWGSVHFPSFGKGRAQAQAGTPSPQGPEVLADQ